MVVVVVAAARLPKAALPPPPPSVPLRPGPGAVLLPVWNVLIGTCYERLDLRCEGFSEITNFPLQEGARRCLPASRGFFFISFLF